MDIMLGKPRSSKKTKPSKRLSAPPQSLAQQFQVANDGTTNNDNNHGNNMISSIPEEQNNNNSNSNNNNDGGPIGGDLLGDLFSDFNGNGSATNGNAAPNSNGNGYAATGTSNGNGNSSSTTTTTTNNQHDDFFDLFIDDNAASRPKASDQPRNTVNTLQIAPNLANPRESRSLRPDKNFIPAMWDTPDDGNQAAVAAAAKNRNTTLNFEPFNIEQKEGKEGGDEDDDDEEEDSDDEEDEDEEEEKPKKKKAESSTAAAPQKPRASAPPTTLSSQTQKVAPEQETNALEELHRGSALLKYPRRSGFPHFKHIQLSEDNLRIEWFSKRKSLEETCIYIRDVKEVIRGQETEVFKKFHQKTLEKSSFSVVYGHQYKSLDVAAKSIDECEMWVRTILKLKEIYEKGKRESDLSALKAVFVGIQFKDRNRPMSRPGSGNFIRANSSKTLKIDPVALKEIERDMEALHKTYSKTAQMAQKESITRSDQYRNIQYVLSELEERIEELSYEVANIRDTELAKREVWRANVDLSAIAEKVEVLLSRKVSKGNRRKSNLM